MLGHPRYTAEAATRARRTWVRDDRLPDGSSWWRCGGTVDLHTPLEPEVAER